MKAFAAAHGGDGEFFGAPTYVATQVVVGAITRACKDGTATRAEVRRQIALTNIPAPLSILGFRIVYQKNGELRFGGFGVFQIQSSGDVQARRVALRSEVHGVRPIPGWAARRL